MDLIKTTVKGEFVILFYFFPFLTAILDNYIMALSDTNTGESGVKELYFCNFHTRLK